MKVKPKNKILMWENIRQKKLVILEYFDQYICHYQPNYSRIDNLFFLTFSDIKMLFFGLSFIL